MVTVYLVDTSVYNRLHIPEVRSRVLDLPARDLRISVPLLVEVGWSARNAGEHAKLVGTLEETYHLVTTSPHSQARAVNVQGMLAARGQHRSAGLADLLIAATAEEHDLTILHYDADFDTIAAVTGQPTEWVVPRGSVS